MNYGFSVCVTKLFLCFCRYAGQLCQLYPHLTNGRTDWEPIDREELLCWFGILVLMGLKEQPSIRTYWSPRLFYNCALISRALTRRRFEAITRCVHLVNNDTLVQDPTNPAYDKIGKVRWLLERFTSIAQSLYNNERIVTVDEIMVPYKG
jgi:hypothetical protein